MLQSHDPLPLSITTRYGGWSLRKYCLRSGKSFRSLPNPIPFIQQENAPPRFTTDDHELSYALSFGGWSFRLANQPANSSDHNVLDLGFSNSTQALQERTAIRDLNQLIQVFQSAFNNLLPRTLNNTFLTLRCCMEKIMETSGCNDYNIPRVSKEALIRQNELIISIQYGQLAVQQSSSFLEAGH